MLRRSNIFCLTRSSNQHCQHSLGASAVDRSEPTITASDRRRFDVVVIGGGPAGLAACLRARDFGRSVCLIERDRIGGADAWNGALQSKTLWEMTSFVHRVKSLSPKVFSRDVKIDAMRVDERRIQATLQSVAEQRVDTFIEALRTAKVTVEYGSASFNDRYSVKLAKTKSASPYVPACSTPVSTAPEGKWSATPTSPDEEIIEADYFIVACGSRPRNHPMIPYDGDTIVSSDEVMLLGIPQSMLIVGSGVIGMEFGGMYSSLGTKVNMIEKAPRVLPNEDEDIALLIEKLMLQRGCSFHHRRQLKDIQVVNGAGGKSVKYTLQSLQDKSNEEVFDVDRALMAIGRVPNYESLNMPAAGLQIAKRGGAVITDEWGCCVLEKGRGREGKEIAKEDEEKEAKDHIFFVGDATVDIALVNKGAREAAAAVQRIYVPDHEGVIGISNLSSIMFLAEEVAGVGLSENQCQQKQISYMVAKYGHDYCVRSIVRSDPVGFVKVIVSNDEKKTVLGVRAVGAHASSIIELASLAVHRKASAYELSELACAYPSQAVVFQEAVRMLIGRSVFKPEHHEGLSVNTWVPDNFVRGRAYQNEVTVDATNKKRTVDK